MAVIDKCASWPCLMSDHIYIIRIPQFSFATGHVWFPNRTREIFVSVILRIKANILKQLHEMNSKKSPTNIQRMCIPLERLDSSGSRFKFPIPGQGFEMIGL